MRKHKFIKFINIDKKLYKILKNLTNKDLAENNIYIKSLDKFVKRCKKILDEKNDLSALIISLYPKNEKISKLSALYIKRLTEIMSGYAGEILHQNSSKDKVIEVFDRSRNLSINRGSRYHQTREGGSIHTDNVNIPSYWDYLMFSCLASAKAGGETILVDSKKIHEELSKNFKEAKKILEKNFYWEKRGLSEELYKAPIISYDKMKQPRFKYLRPYLDNFKVIEAV